METIYFNAKLIPLIKQAIRMAEEQTMITNETIVVKGISEGHAGGISVEISDTRMEFLSKFFIQLGKLMESTERDRRPLFEPEANGEVILAKLSRGSGNQSACIIYLLSDVDAEHINREWTIDRNKAKRFPDVGFVRNNVEITYHMWIENIITPSV